MLPSIELQLYLRYPGSLLDTPTMLGSSTQSTADKCAIQCKANPSCVSFNWVDGNNNDAPTSFRYKCMLLSKRIADLNSQLYTNSTTSFFDYFERSVDCYSYDDYFVKRLANPNVCQGLTVCQAGTYQLQESTFTSDRVCSPCPAGSFQPAINRQSCSVWTLCANITQEVSAPTPTSDRVCSASNSMIGVDTAASATSSFSIGAVIGAVVGLVVVLMTVGLIAYMRRPKEQQLPAQHERQVSRGALQTSAHDQVFGHSSPGEPRLNPLFNTNGKSQAEVRAMVRAS
jgi:hypothetical protein